jgi:hypothetical protein
MKFGSARGGSGALAGRCVTEIETILDRWLCAAGVGGSFESERSACIQLDDLNSITWPGIEPAGKKSTTRDDSNGGVVSEIQIRIRFASKTHTEHRDTRGLADGRHGKGR